MNGGGADKVRTGTVWLVVGLAMLLGSLLLGFGKHEDPALGFIGGMLLLFGALSTVVGVAMAAVGARER